MNAALASAMPARIGWPGAVLLILAGVVSAFQVGKPSAVLPVLQADLGMDIRTAGWLVSASGVAGAVAGAPIGLLIDRIGARRMTLLGLAVQAFASAAGALATAPGWLLASRIVEGLGFQWVVVAAPALIADTMRPRSTATAMAAWSTFMPPGLAGALVSGAGLSPASAWECLWWSGTVLAVLAAVAVRSAVPEPPRTAATRIPSMRSDVMEAWRARGPVLLALVFGLFNAVYFAVYGFLPMLLQQASHAIGAPAYVLAAVAVGASAAGNLAGLALLARGIPPAALLAWSFAGLAACSLPILLDVTTNAWLRIAASIAFGAVAGLVSAALFAQAPARAGRHAGPGHRLDDARRKRRHDHRHAAGRHDRGGLRLAGRDRGRRGARRDGHRDRARAGAAGPRGRRRGVDVSGMDRDAALGPPEARAVPAKQLCMM